MPEKIRGDWAFSLPGGPHRTFITAPQALSKYLTLIWWNPLSSVIVFDSYFIP